jgi:hypothetical protein
MTDLADDARPCEHPGCHLPGRFAIGMDHGAMRYWCVDHIEDGMDYFGALVRGIREAIGRPPWLRETEPDRWEITDRD